MENLKYAGNRLLNVTDSGDKTGGFKEGDNTDDDYAYDSNGNMTQDQNKHLGSIIYNYLNLPENVTKGSDDIQYVYAANGSKLTQTVTENGRRSRELCRQSERLARLEDYKSVSTYRIR